MCNNYDQYKTEPPPEGEKKMTYYCQDCDRHFSEDGSVIFSHEAHPCYENETCTECKEVYVEECRE
jgi:hypothetical protein